MANERGQVQIEAIAAVGLLVLAAILGVRAVAAINAVLVADGAAHAGALAQSAGGDGSAAARRALPKGVRSASHIRAGDGEVSIRLGSVGVMAWSRLPAR